MEALVEYLYTDQARDVTGSNDMDFLSSVLVGADELLCEGLKELAGQSLLKLITIRNAADLCLLAFSYNALSLKRYAQEFIVTNMAAFFEAR